MVLNCAIDFVSSDDTKNYGGRFLLEYLVRFVLLDEIIRGSGVTFTIAFALRSLIWNNYLIDIHLYQEDNSGLQVVLFMLRIFLVILWYAHR